MRGCKLAQLTPRQTTFILSKLSLAWPRSTTVINNVFALSPVSLESARPECLTGRDDLPLYSIYTISRILLPLLLLLLIITSRRMAERAFSREWRLAKEAARSRIVEAYVRTSRVGEGRTFASGQPLKEAPPSQRALEMAEMDRQVHTRTCGIQ